MKVRGLADKTQKAYVHELDKAAKHFGCSPALQSGEQIQQYVVMRIDEGLLPCTTNITVSAFGIFYEKVLKCPDRVEGLTHRNISSLREFFEYIDEDMRWWQKRYSWELANQGD